MNDPGLRSYELTILANPLVSILITIGPGVFDPTLVHACLQQQYREVEVVCLLVRTDAQTKQQLLNIQARDSRLKIYVVPEAIASDFEQLSRYFVTKATGHYYLIMSPHSCLRKDGLHALIKQAQPLGQIVVSTPAAVHAFWRKRSAQRADYAPEQYLLRHGATFDGLLIARSYYVNNDLPKRQKNLFDPLFFVSLMCSIPPEQFRCVPAAMVFRPPVVAALGKDTNALMFELGAISVCLTNYADWNALLARSDPRWITTLKQPVDQTLMTAIFEQLLWCWRSFDSSLRAQMVNVMANLYGRVLKTMTITPPRGVDEPQSDRALLWYALTRN